MKWDGDELLRSRCERVPSIVVDDRFGCDERPQRRFDHRCKIALWTFRLCQGAPNRDDEAKDFHFASRELVDDQRLNLNSSGHAVNHTRIPGLACADGWV